MNQFLLDQIEREVGSDKIQSELTEYIQSPDCTTLTEHLVCFCATGRDVRIDGPLRRELETGASRYVDVAKVDLDSLYRILLGSVERVLEYAGVSGHEDAQEKSRDVGADQAIEVYLRSIDSQIELLTRQGEIDLKGIDGTLSRYRDAIKSTIGKIQPPNFDGSEPVDTDRLFVAPVIKSPATEAQYDLSDLLAAHRCVILGDPGGGKTTLSRKLALDLVSARATEPNRDVTALVPFIVVLRDFGSFLRRTTGSVSDFLSENIRASYQCSISADEIEHLLAVGRAYVIFDGLDELLEPRDRLQVADIVTAFSALFTNSGILVTSRRVGYLQAPLPEESFVPLSLEGFDSDQVAQYVKNWFALVPDLSEERRNELVERFVADSNAVPELQSSPLLLALMCTIYRFEGYIPRNRPDVYEKCSKMLFDRWDRHRGLREEFDFEAHIEPALMSLAYSIYLDADLQSGVTEARLVGLAANYLDEWQYNNRTLAEHAAAQFVGFCRGRAWVFTDVGITAEGDALYAFTHRTFLEYFAASHLTRTCGTLNELIDELKQKIRQNEWDVVAQLSLQSKAKASQGGPDVVALELLRLARDEDDVESCRNIAAFLSRCLAFFPLSPRCASEIGLNLAAIVIDSYVLDGKVDRQDRTGTSRVLANVIDALRESAKEVRTALLGSTMESLLRILRSDEKTEEGDHRREIAAGAAWGLDRPSDYPGEALTEKLTELDDVLFEVAYANRFTWGDWVAIALYWRGNLSPTELVELIPLESVRFSSHQIGMHSLLQPLFSALRDFIHHRDSATPSTFQRAQDLIGCYADKLRTGAPVPSSKLTGTGNILDSLFWDHWSGGAERVRNEPSAQGEIDFILVLAFVHEAQQEELQATTRERLGEVYGPLSYALDIIAARGNYQGLDDSMLSQMPIGDGREKIIAWANDDLDLIQSME